MAPTPAHRAWEPDLLQISGQSVASSDFPRELRGRLRLTYYVLNTSLIAIAVGLETQRSIWDFWKQNYGWVTLNYLLLTALGVGIASVYQELGIIGIFLFLVPLLMARYSFMLYMRSTEAVRRQNEELQVANQRLHVMAAVAHALSSALQWTETCAAVTGAAVDLMGWAWCILMAQDDEGQWTIESRQGIPRDVLEHSVAPTTTASLLIELEPAREPYVIDESHRSDLFRSWRRRGLESEAVVVLPLTADDYLEAVILIGAAASPDAAQLQELTIFASQALSSLEKAAIHETTKRQAHLDSLTGVYNHRYLQERLQRDIEQAEARGGILSMLMIDINGFKQFNDTYGHLVGDHVLRMIANTIEENTRGEDPVCRYGGDEFAVLLVNADKSRALEIADRIEKAIEGHSFNLEGLTTEDSHNMGVSIGISTYPEPAASRQALIDQADRALYQAKKLGGGAVYFRPDLKAANELERVRIVK